MYKLIIGNRNYSSWSLRVWFHLSASKIAFDEHRIPMFSATWKSDIKQYSPSGRVPVLIDDGITIWDTPAIIGHIREQHPNAVGWPADAKARALARSISSEMHSGFLAVRDELPQNLRARHALKPDQLSGACRNQIARIDAIWSQCRRDHGARGPWLFGDLSIADIMFTPVALRFVTYAIEVSDTAAQFIAAVSASPLIQQWIAAAQAETESISFVDDLTPAAESPLTLG